MEFYVSRSQLGFVEDIIKKSSFANQNGFKFYKIFRAKWEHELLWPTFRLEDDFYRQGVSFKRIDSQVTESLTRARGDSLKERMLGHNGVRGREVGCDEDAQAPRLRLVDNSAYVFCETYMPRFLVPRVISNTQLGKICKYRVKGRVPILCFRHQPLSGRLSAF